MTRHATRRRDHVASCHNSGQEVQLRLSASLTHAFLLPPSTCETLCLERPTTRSVLRQWLVLTSLLRVMPSNTTKPGFYAVAKGRKPGIYTEW